jgi:hypothetical protein
MTSNKPFEHQVRQQEINTNANAVAINCSRIQKTGMGLSCALRAITDPA